MNKRIFYHITVKDWIHMNYTNEWNCGWVYLLYGINNNKDKKNKNQKDLVNNNKIVEHVSTLLYWNQ